VIYIDRFGNLITNIPSDILPKDVEQKKTTMISGDYKWEHLPFVSSYGFVKPGDVLLTIGSNSFLEISVNQGNAAKTLMIKEDAEIQLLFS
jgi:S-adenosylmethionine hydrolase